MHTKSNEPMIINGLALPLDLQISLKKGEWLKLGGSDDGRWNDTSRISIFGQLFTHIEQLIPRLFSFENMILFTEMWIQSDIPDAYIGVASISCPPGDIDPSSAIIIGESEPDSPIALDYRTTIPRVIYFCDIGDETLWVEASKSITVAIETLCLP
jgi:hypothetical protein